MDPLTIFVGLHQPSDAGKVECAFISVHRLAKRKSDFVVGDWIMDSGAFSTIQTHGGYPEPPEAYAAQIERWSRCGRMRAAVTQDFMCEPHMLARTGLSVEQHQALTIERYDALLPLVHSTYLMPVLQGYDPEDYRRHVRAYGARLAPGAWVGVGSICKRNTNPSAIAAVLATILDERPDLRLHGFGIKKTALYWNEVRDRLYSCDSMAWSYAARLAGRGGNDVRDAVRWLRDVEAAPVQMALLSQGGL